MNTILSIPSLIQSTIVFTMIIMVGLYFIFSNTVMASLKNIPNGADVMVEINQVILNPIFMSIFVVSGIGSAYLAVFSQDALRWSGGIFFVGTTLVTMLKNVPLNNKLRDAKEEKQRANVWDEYLQKWVFWNHVRTVSAMVSGLGLALWV